MYILSRILYLIYGLSITISFCNWFLLIELANALSLLKFNEVIHSNEILENNRGVSQTPKNWKMLIHVVPSGSKLVIYCLKRISVLMLHSILVSRRVLLAYITLLSLVAGCSRF